MRSTLIRFLGWLLLCFFLLPSAHTQAVDASCTGVQLAAAEMRVDALGPAGPQFKDVLEKMRLLKEDDDANNIRPAEQRWSDAEKRNSLPPDLPWAELNARIKASAELDNALAQLLVAQYRAHAAEAAMIIAEHDIPVPNNNQKVADAANSYAAEHSLSGNAAKRVAESPSFRRLLSILEASRVASRSSYDIPAAPLSRVGFDDKSDDPSLQSAVKALAGLLVRADANRQEGELILDHLGRFVGNAASRGTTLRQPETRTAHEVTLETGKALSKIQASNLAFEKINRLVLPKDQGTKDWKREVSSEVKQVVAETINFVLIGGADKSANGSEGGGSK